MNLVWLCCFLTDTAFFGGLFRREAYAPDRRRPWLRYPLLLLLAPLYLGGVGLPLPYAALRIATRAAVYFFCLRLADGIPLAGAAYASLFWTAVYSLFQNVISGPVFFSIFAGTLEVLSSPLWNQVFLCFVNVLLRLAYLGLVAFLLPFEGLVAGVEPLHAAFAGTVCLITVYTKGSGTPLLDLFAEAPGALSLYFILLHVVLLLLLLTFELSRRQSVEREGLRLQGSVDRALLESIRDHRLGEESVRALCHDLKNHLLSLKLLLEGGRTGEALAYVEKFLAETKPPEGSYRTGNDLLDGLLRLKLFPAREKGIQAEVTLDFRSGGFLSAFDLCTLMGNVVDNALEAAAQVEPQEARYLRISGGPAANCLLVRVENSCPAHSPRPLSAAFPSTTKEDRIHHGFGLRNVRRVLNRCGGNLTISAGEGRFVLSMLIPVPEDT